MQHRRALLVAAAHRVHQRSPERRERAGQQRRVADAARLGARLPQARTPGSTAPAATAARPASSCPRAAARSPPAAALGRRARRRAAHARVGRAPELAAEQDARRRRRARARRRPRRPAQGTHEQLVGAVVEAVERDRPRRQRGAVKRRTGRQRAQRRIPQHGLAHAREPPALDQQPRIELGARAGLDPFEQLAAHERRIAAAGGQRQHVHERRPPAAPAPADRRVARRRRRARGAAAPASSAAPPVDRRRHQTSARPAASAATGRSASRRKASTAHALCPRGGRQPTPSRSISGGPSRRITSGDTTCDRKPTKPAAAAAGVRYGRLRRQTSTTSRTVAVR